MKRRAPAGEQLPLDLGTEAPVGTCAACHAPLRRGHDVIVRRAYRFGVCLVSLHRTCLETLGEDGLARLVAEREARWARILGVPGA